MDGLITCVCVANHQQPGLIARAVVNFAKQTYRDKQLLVITSKPLPELTNTLQRHEAVQTANVHWHVVDGATHHGMYLYALIQLAKRSGMFCFWDADDASHPQRLSVQAAHCLIGRPVFLSAASWFFYDSRELFIVETEVRHKPLHTRVLLGSMLAVISDLCNHAKIKLVAGNPGHSIAQHVFDVTGKNPLRVIGEWGWLRIGVHSNVSGYDRHRQIVMRHSLSTPALVSQRSAIEQLVFGDSYLWEDVSPVAICGGDGSAFELTPSATWDTELPALDTPWPGVIREQEPGSATGS